MYIMKKSLESFNKFQIINLKFIFGGNGYSDDDSHKKGKIKARGQGVED